MTTKEVIAYYGSIRKMAVALDIWPNVVYTWGERPPMRRQYEIEVKTKGALKADREDEKA